jgi:hypothetical protein
MPEPAEKAGTKSEKESPKGQKGRKFTVDIGVGRVADLSHDFAVLAVLAVLVVLVWRRSWGVVYDEAELAVSRIVEGADALELGAKQLPL